MIKYLTHRREAKITPIEVERETAKYVWIKGRRHGKRTEWDNYFDTWEEAKDFLMKGAEGALKTSRLMLERAQGHYGNVKGLKKDG